MFNRTYGVEEFYEKLSTDPVVLLYIIKKYLQNGEELPDIAEEITKDRNAFIMIFIAHPDFEELFFTQVEELATIEADRLKKRSLVLALKELNTTLTTKRSESDPKDRVAAARALMGYEVSSRPKGKGEKEKTELDKIYESLMSFKGGKNVPDE